MPAYSFRGIGQSVGTSWDKIDTPQVIFTQGDDWNFGTDRLEPNRTELVRFFYSVQVIMGTHSDNDVITSFRATNGRTGWTCSSEMKGSVHTRNHVHMFSGIAELIPGDYLQIEGKSVDNPFHNLIEVVWNLIDVT